MGLGRSLLGLAVLAAAVSNRAACPPATELRRRFAAAVPDVSQAREVADVVLPIGQAMLELHRGWVVPVSWTTGTLRQAVFLGDATLKLAPSDEVEAHQLDVYSGSRAL